MTTDLYCMSCVPLRPGVWSIALLQVLKFNAKGSKTFFTSSDLSKVSIDICHRKALK